MSVRQVKYRNPTTGKWKSFWTVDIQFRHSDGHVERIRKASPVQTKRGAEQYERELRQSMLEGNHDKKEVVVPTCQEFSEEFLRTYVKTNNKPSECQTKTGVFNARVRSLRLRPCSWTSVDFVQHAGLRPLRFKNHINPAFGKLKLDQIRGQEIERFKARKLAEGLSPKTVNNYLTVLRRMLSLAHEWDLISGVPHFKWLKAPEPGVDFLSFEEADRLVKAADPNWDVMILTGLRAGLRHGELIGLRWEDVDLVAGRLVVRQSIVRGVIGPLWRACRRAGLRKIGWHCLRHTFASHLVMRGVPLKAVQELMGHATIEMTMRYHRT